MSASLREGERGREAHRGCIGGLGELGEASEAANRQRRFPVAEEGNGDVGGGAGLP